jgi:hypothetical protein
VARQVDFCQSHRHVIYSPLMQDDDLYSGYDSPSPAGVSAVDDHIPHNTSQASIRSCASL